ncbi:MAG: hypothetical protein EGP81_08840 [Bacteroides clarus]|nr:hypothetical protein [Bacteroides clarus]
MELKRITDWLTDITDCYHAQIQSVTLAIQCLTRITDSLTEITDSDLLMMLVNNVILIFAVRKITKQ